MAEVKLRARPIKSIMVFLCRAELVLLHSCCAEGNLKLKEQEVGLVVNATMHQERLVASHSAVARADANSTARVNLVIVTGQPMWSVRYTTCLCCSPS